MTRAVEAAGAPAHDARPRLLAVCAGRAAPLLVRENDDRPRTVVSGIAKQAISTLDDPVAVAIGTLGVDGDEIVDLTVHGGLDKAVYLYPAEHYAFWNTVRSQAGRPEALQPGALGENLLVQGLLEPALWVGDRLRIGEVELRLESARSPCFKFNVRMGFSWASKMMVQSGFTGAYCAVVRPGRLTAGDPIDVLPGDRIVTIEQSHRLRHGNRQSPLF
jgi:MOSC domain-containing protein YiiM